MIRTAAATTAAKLIIPEVCAPRRKAPQFYLILTLVGRAGLESVTQAAACWTPARGFPRFGWRWGWWFQRC